MIVSKNTAGGLPGGPAVQDLSSHAGDARSVAGWGTKTPPCLMTRKPTRSKDPGRRTLTPVSHFKRHTQLDVRPSVSQPRLPQRLPHLGGGALHPPRGSAQRVILESSLFIPYLILQQILLVLPSESVQNLTCFLVALATSLAEVPRCPLTSPRLALALRPGARRSPLLTLAASWVCSSSLTLFPSLLRGHFLGEGPSFLFKIATDPHPPSPS